MTDFIPIDLRDDLDVSARGKPRPEPRPKAAKGNGKAATDHVGGDDGAAFDPGEGDETEGAFDPGEEFDLEALRQTITICAPGTHAATLGFAWHMASHDLPANEIVGMLYDLYDRCPQAHRDERWHKYRADIQRTVEGTVEKIAGIRRSNGETHAGNGAAHDPWTSPIEPEPADPLIVPSQPQAAYPIDALAQPFFVDTVHAVSRVVEADLSLAGTVTLAAMSTAVARITLGVEMETELVAPASLYTADIVGSSERKTSAEKKVFAGIQAFIDEVLVPEYQRLMKEYNAALAIYEHDRRSILSSRGHAKNKQKDQPADNDPAAFDTGGGDTLASLMGLEEPTPPAKPYIVTNDFTVEGMRDALATNSGQLAIVTSEGAVMIGGYSLGDKTRRGASAGSLSRYWDGLSDTVTRANGRVITVQDPRVSLSIGVQPRVAATFFADLDLRDQGIVNRFLVTWPAPLAGSRTLSPPAAADLAIIKRFNDQAQACLRQAYGLAAGDDAEGRIASRMPDALPLTPEARALWRTFAQGVERGQAKDQKYEQIIGWAGKAAEQAARIALVLTLFSDSAAKVVDEAAMAAGIHLAWWYCNEWLRVCEMVEPSPEQKLGARVAEWLRATYGSKTDDRKRQVKVTSRDLYRNNVAGIATRDQADRVLELLGRHGVIMTDDPPKPKRHGRVPLVRWYLPES